MKDVHTEWSVKYPINLDDMISKIWKMSATQFSFDVMCVVVGDREEDSFLVMELFGEVIQFAGRNLLLFRSLHLWLRCENFVLCFRFATEAGCRKLVGKTPSEIHQKKAVGKSPENPRQGSTGKRASEIHRKIRRKLRPSETLLVGNPSKMSVRSPSEHFNNEQISNGMSSSEIKISRKRRFPTESTVPNLFFCGSE